MSRSISSILLLSAVLLVVVITPLIFVDNSSARNDNLNIHERVDALEDTIERLEVKLSDANATIDRLREVQGDLEQGVRTLHLDFLPFGNLLSCIKFESGVLENLQGPHVIIEGCNLHVRNGDKEEPNGLGNLILGYDAGSSRVERTGSHFLVIGEFNEFTGDSGMVVAGSSRVHSLRALEPVIVIGGLSNTADGRGVVLGGTNNEIIFDRNIESLPSPVIVNGFGNKIQGRGIATIIGGENNVTIPEGQEFPVRDNTVIVGGKANQTFGDYSAILGGFNNITEIETEYSTVVGGFENKTLENYATVCGGRLNVASGEHSTVSGGQLNTASGNASSVSGGVANTASGDSSAVSGGSTNMASGPNSCVSGGAGGIASGVSSSLSGGNNRSATGTFDWVAGGLFQDF